jgi:hypothetical protein
MKLPARATAYPNIALLDLAEAVLFDLDAALNMVLCDWTSKHEHTALDRARNRPSVAADRQCRVVQL